MLTRGHLLAVHRWYQAGVGAFVVSAGFAGLCAVLVGVGTLIGVLRTVAANREVARAQQWQNQFGWVYEHASTGPRRDRLPPAVAVAMYQQLAGSARSSVESGMVAGVMSLFQRR